MKWPENLDILTFDEGYDKDYVIGWNDAITACKEAIPSEREIFNALKEKYNGYNTSLSEIAEIVHNLLTNQKGESK